MKQSVCGWLYIYIYIYIYGEMVHFGESDKMIKISGKMDKSDPYKEFIQVLLGFYEQTIRNSGEKKGLKNTENSIFTFWYLSFSSTVLDRSVMKPK